MEDGIWLCGHCDSCLYTNDDGYPKMDWSKPLERILEMGIRQRKCLECEKNAFCKYYR